MEPFGFRIAIERHFLGLCRRVFSGCGANDFGVGIEGVFLRWISQQLKLLTLAGFLERRREGRNIFYRLKDEKVISILHHLKSLYQDLPAGA